MVEDDEISCKSLKLILTHHGYDVVTASTLGGARALLGKNITHALIDLMLPDGDGASLLTHIRDQKLPIWVGVLTGVNDPDRLKAVKSLQPSLVLQKPIDLTRLFDALK